MFLPPKPAFSLLSISFVAAFPILSLILVLNSLGRLSNFSTSSLVP